MNMENIFLLWTAMRNLCFVATLLFLPFVVSADDAITIPKAELAKYYLLVTGKELSKEMVSFSIDPNVSKSGNDAYSIVSEGGTAAAHSA